MDWFDLAWWLFILIIVVQLARLIFADGDLALMWAERFGKPVQSLAGQVVWITGASSGIGEHLAYELARAGCKLVLSARRLEELERVKKQCLLSGRVSEEDILVLKLDQMDMYLTHQERAEQVLQKFGTIDILVNNAGRSQRALIEETELEVDQALMDVNYIGVLKLTKYVLAWMVDKNKGHIVTTSSVNGKMGMPCMASYAASKHALHGWMGALRAELGMSPVTISMLCPGPTHSNAIKEAITGYADVAFGKNDTGGLRRMNTDRCAKLMAVAIANRLEEAWICQHPILLLVYLNQYVPRLVSMIMKKQGAKAIKAFKGE